MIDESPRPTVAPDGARRMQVLVLGLNHRSAPVEVRERVTFPAGRLPSALAELRGQPEIAEAVILSTCNRTEIYCATGEPGAAGRAVTAYVAAAGELDEAALRPHLYELRERAAAEHLFRVAAGLDSMILGEGQILAQVREAWQAAHAAGAARACLAELFQRGLRLGKLARSETGIHRGAVSISSAAVDLARQVFGELRGRQALVVGAGEMSEQTLRHLVGQGVESVIVANRTFARAEELAGRYNGRAIRFDEFADQLARIDILVSSSASPHPILTVDKLKPALAGRRGRPLFLIDIAVPRDIEAAVGQLPNVYLFDIDDLAQVAERYRAERAKEVVKVEALLTAELDAWTDWLESRGVTPLIAELRTRVDGLRDAELERWLRKLDDLDERERELVRQMMRSFANKLLHGPMCVLKRQAGTPDEADCARLVRHLFQLDGGEREP